jgi:hypothetical protein
MIYFEHCLRQARVPAPRRIHILSDGAEPWLVPDLRAEMLDLYPQAVVGEGPVDEGPPPDTDLVVLPLLEAYEFPHQDVVYRSLPLLRDLGRGPLGRSRAHVLIYRARWREAEVVPAASLRRYASRRALERRVIEWVRRSALLTKNLQRRH